MGDGGIIFLGGIIPIKKKHFILLVIFCTLAIIFICVYIQITRAPINPFNYNIAFDEIKCCMTYDELIPILGEGKVSSWEVKEEDKSKIIPPYYQFHKRFPSSYEFTNGVYTIFTVGEKLTYASIGDYWSPGEPFKKLNNCTC